ncbi:MAG: Protease IV [uncultured Rubrobacteraceae bacterium]|uniref:Protease IV n=1 Tax=uncultured Rubrobacteraceae bacterium TaxID=349277 RepID=A0A6J4RC57_9ACTN|nr:MAG: Protease IV [uncultured Rubrobacteraceae bacterium]
MNAVVNLYRLLRNALVRAFRRPPDLVWISVSGGLPEFEPGRRGLLRRRLAPGSSGPSLEALRSRLDRILADGRPAGVILRVENLDAGWASLEELRREIERFRGRGKKVVAYLIDPGTRDYYLASAADEILATPLSTLNVVGISARVNFLKDALSRVGLRTEVVAVSPYKSAGDTLARSDFSEESREQVERLLDRRFGSLVAAISTGRKVSPEQARKLINAAPYTAAAAEAEGLLDGVAYEDELAGRLGEGGRRARLAEWSVARRALRVPYRRRSRKAVALVRVEGAITRGSSRKLPVPLPLIGKEQAGSDSVAAALRVAERNKRVGSVLLYVDSPGGDALASDLIWREVERLGHKKPVVVLMGNAAASGGYYVSAPAKYIVARENTVTGSIGVILTRPVATRLLGNLGVNPVSVERGARANLLDPRHEPTADELSVLRTQLTGVYGAFKDRVVEGRGLNPAALEELAGGRVWTGAEALEKGLVDEIGGFRTALEKAEGFAGAGGGEDTLLKITVPKNSRPSPGEPVREAVDAVTGAFADLKTPRTWALAPYDLGDDR